MPNSTSISSESDFSKDNVFDRNKKIKKEAIDPEREYKQ